jgi:selenocysteine lyase/cysteine desulfurase
MAQDTGIVSAGKENTDFKKLSRKLAEQGIIAKERLCRLRIAPHIYNSFEQLDKTAEIIKTLS